jgi:UDP-N-acetylglucosamine diphosphorylase/glucosamine-1-phosphate N-acetyltransferase
MNIILFDDKMIRENLLPFTFTRPVAEIRCGILSISEKWRHYYPEAVISYATQAYLSQKFPIQTASDNWLINGALCPNPELAQHISALASGSSLVMEDGTLLAARLQQQEVAAFIAHQHVEHPKTYHSQAILIRENWHIFKQNAAQIKADFAVITKGRTSAPITDPFTKVYGPQNLFVEEGAVIRAAIIDAEAGPVYIGRNAVVHEGSIIKGSFALCEGSHVNMGAKIKGDSTVGPHCKVGGEVSNSVFFGYSNKAHDGFIGNSVVGEWCNLGADTNTSNLKNNYASVKLWHYAKGGFKDTGEQFCGLMMGDHSKCGINTMFNTGTVVGVSANIFGDGFPRNFIPSFAWGGAAGFSTFALPKAYEVAQKVMERRNKQLDETEKALLKAHFDDTVNERSWERKA